MEKKQLKIMTKKEINAGQRVNIINIGKRQQKKCENEEVF